MTTEDKGNAEVLTHSYLGFLGGGPCPSICKAPARDLGQWDGVDPLHRQWFNGLMQLDRPNLSCCGEADGYWADSYEVKGDQYVV